MSHYTLKKYPNFNENLSEELKKDVIDTLEYFGTLWEWNGYKTIEDFLPREIGWAMARSIAYGKYHSALTAYKHYYDTRSVNNEEKSDMHIAAITEFIARISNSENFPQFLKNVQRMTQAIELSGGRYNVVWYGYMNEGQKAPWYGV